MQNSLKIHHKLLQLRLIVAYIWNSLVLYSFNTRTGPKHLGQLIACWLVCLAIALWRLNPAPTLSYTIVTLLGSALLLVTMSLAWCRWQFKKLFDHTPPLSDVPHQIAKLQSQVSDFLTSYWSRYQQVQNHKNVVKAQRAELLADAFGFVTNDQAASAQVKGELPPNPGKILNVALATLGIIGTIIIVGTAYFGW